MIIVVLCVTSVHAQDPQFSQFYANPVYTNPAFAGSSNVGRGVLNYRSQWPSISGTFRTFSASYDEHFDVINGGFGVLVTGDEAGEGTLQSFSLSGIYSYQIIINKFITIRAGIQVVQKSIEFGKLKFYDQIVKQKGFIYDTREQIASPTIFYPNFSAGLVTYTNYFYAGVAAHNIIEPKQGFFQTQESKVPIRYTAHTGLMIPLVKTKNEKRASNLYPNVIYMRQQNFSQLNAGMYYSHGPFVLGGYFRQAGGTSDALIALLGIRHQKLRIGFSYDQTLSEAYPGAKQSYEVSLAVELRKRVPRRTFRSIKCPDF